MTLIRFLPAALLATALTAPAAGQTADDIKKINDKLDRISKDLQDLKDGLKTEELRKATATIDSKIDLMDQDIRTIKDDLRQLKRRVGDGTTTTLRPEIDSSTVRGQGRVRFINEFPGEISVVLNSRAFRLLPGQERLVPVTPGEFTYQVLNVQRDIQTRRIAADETKNIRIFPLP